MKVSKADIKFFKGVLLVNLHDELNKTHTRYSLEELENLLKYMSDIDLNTSVKDITKDQMQDLKESAQFLAVQCRIKITRDDYLDDLTNLNF